MTLVSHGPDVLFYFDPPYWGCEADYGAGFERADFERLADQLAAIAGRFVLSINATDGAREEVETTYTIATATSGSGSRVKELIVRGSG